MKSRLLICVLGVVLSMTPSVGRSAAKLDGSKSIPGNLTLLPGPHLLSPAKQHSAGIQPQLRLGEIQLLPPQTLPPSTRHPAALPSFETTPPSLRVGSGSLSISSVSSAGGTAVAGRGELTFRPESRWFVRNGSNSAPIPADEDAELKAAREKYEAAKAHLEELLARRGRALPEHEK